MPPEGAVGFLIVGEGVVAGDTEQHRRHAERQRDLARRDMFHLDEIHILWRKTHRLPVETALKQQRPAGIRCPLKAALELRLEAVILFARERAVLALKNQRAGGPRGIVEQRLVPGAGGIVNVDADGRRLQRAHAVMVVVRVEQSHMQDWPYAALYILGETHGLPAGGIFIRLGPAIRSGDDLHAVGPQHMQLAHLAGDGYRLHEAVPCHQKIAVPGLEHIRRALGGVGPGEEPEKRMRVARLAILERQQRHRRRRLADHAHAAIDDGVFGESFTREIGIVARRPDRLA